MKKGSTTGENSTPLLKTKDFLILHSSFFWCPDLAHDTIIPPTKVANHVLPTEAPGTSGLHQTSEELVAPMIADASMAIPATSTNIEEATSPAVSSNSIGAQHAWDTQTEVPQQSGGHDHQVLHFPSNSGESSSVGLQLHIFKVQKENKTNKAG
ncbi:hypothetical protein V6N11_029224 [Hibiscus sabdariffa]|uniref:Uncharacterized protein n=2 Tax=Hibiscus sabdariffa TaxID=183260 RepID=A0ABR2BL07_9ROSI